MKSDTFDDWQLGEPLHPAPQIKAKNRNWAIWFDGFEWLDFLPALLLVSLGFLAGFLFALGFSNF